MKNIKERIASFLRAQSGKGYKTKELARALQLPKQGKGYQQLKAALRALQNAGTIQRAKGSRWSVPRAVERKETVSAEQENSVIVGTLKRFRDVFVVTPDGRGAKEDVFIPKRKLSGAADGDKVVLRMLPDSGRQGSSGEVLEVLGAAGNPDVETVGLARRYGLTFDFPDNVEDEAAAISASIEEEEIAKRLDLRDLECFTIDPDDAQDFDDAVSLDLDDDGNYRLGVHIADVSHYVVPGSAIDREAYQRATSVYLVGEVFPMLPERLSNHLCSLKEGKDRLCYSVFMTISPRGALKKHHAGKSVIRSQKRFTYKQAQAILDGGEGPHRETLLLMEKLANTLMKKRLREGSIDFNMPEVKVILNTRGRAEDIVPAVRLMSMRMVEEFMLAANKTMAAAAKSRALIYRVHDTPDPEKVRELLDFLQHLGIRATLDPASSKSFQQLIESLKVRPEADVVQDVTIRSMAKAVYSVKNIGHFGLGFSLYTHFTSPIRRYPDLMVHRLAQSILEGGTAEYSRPKLEQIAEHSSARERLAVEAERESKRIKQVEYMRSRQGEDYDGIVNGVTSYGLYVQIIPTMVEGLVHVKNMNGYFEYDSRGRRLKQRNGKKVYSLGDRVRVRVARVDMQEKRIDFELIEGS